MQKPKGIAPDTGGCPRCRSETYTCHQLRYGCVYQCTACGHLNFEPMVSISPALLRKEWSGRLKTVK